MASDGTKVGTWNLGYGSNMNVKHITEKKGVKILGENKSGKIFPGTQISSLFGQTIRPPS